MSEDVAIRLSGVGKMYKIYPTRWDSVLDSLGLTRFRMWRRSVAQEFWALRAIELAIPKGTRLGIIGRNGAGKSTLLRLITGNMAPTEGEIEVNGEVQALLEAGAGFHPEFTGHENVRASLSYQGLTPAEIETALREIAEFTELGQFLAQPFKTYSSGMQARLVFATATVLKPDILIVDEILGAGDAYFAAKSAERMRELVEESGATVLLVSHALDQVARYCDESLWMERGRIVMRGPSLELINAYQEFIHHLDDRRLKARRRKRMASVDPAMLDSYADAMVVTIAVTGPPGARCDVAEVALLANDQPEETLRVGDAQDATPGHASTVSLTSSRWSDPRRERGRWFRSLEAEDERAAVQGQVIFYSYALLPEIQYRCRLHYRVVEGARVSVSVVCNGEIIAAPVPLPEDARDWVAAIVPVTRPRLTAAPEAAAEADHTTKPASAGASVRRWPGEGSVRIEQAILTGADEMERAVFEVGSPLTLHIELRAARAGRFNLVVAATLARLDGVFVSNFVGEPTVFDLSAGESRWVAVTLDPLLLGDGQYVFSLSAFEGVVLGETRYDLVARAYEFRVIGNAPLVSGAVFQHPARWSVDAPVRYADA